MTEIVNLRRVKKARNRAAAADEAAANRAMYGRNQAERTASATQNAHHDRTLDGAKLTRDGKPGE